MTERPRVSVVIPAYNEGDGVVSVLNRLFESVRLPSEVLVPGGPFTMGTSTEPWALDNERPAHTVQVAPFYLDTTPVTCGAYAQFIDDGGYDDRRWWTGAGAAPRCAPPCAPRWCG